MGKCYIFGADDLSVSRKKARECLTQLAGANWSEDPGFEEIAVDGDGKRAELLNAALGKFLLALRTPPFLAERQWLWFRDCPDLTAFLGGSEALPAASAVIAELAAGLPDYQTVVISGGGLDQRTSGVKKAKKFAELENFSSPKAGDRDFAEQQNTLIKTLVAAENKEIAFDALQYLSNVLPGNAGVVEQEISKICLYVGDAPRITLADAQAIAANTPEAVIWDLSGAVESRDAGAGLRALAKLLKQGLEPIAAIGIIGRSLQKMISLKAALAELDLNNKPVTANTFGALPALLKEQHPDNELLKMHPYRAFKVASGAQQYQTEELAQALALTVQVNRKMVSLSCDGRIELENLLLKICAGNRF